MASTTKKEQNEDSNLSMKEKNIRKRVALEKQAFHIVENLLEKNITEEYLLQVGNLICPRHYNDVVEERNISNMCGYPICDKNLPPIPKQKYHISTQSNKVYDITERKSFCSNQCYKASKFYENQISTSPVWARENEPPVNFILLQSNSGSCGDEVIGFEHGGNILKKDVQQLKKLDSAGTRQKIKEKKTAEISTPSKELEKLDINSDLVGEKMDEDYCNKKASSVNSETENNHPFIHLETCSGAENSKTSKVQVKVKEPCHSKSDNGNIDSLKYLGNSDTVVSTSEKKSTEEKTSREGLSQGPTESKTDYMMRLLNQRKNLLSKLADDKAVTVGESSQSPKKEENVINSSYSSNDHSEKISTETCSNKNSKQFIKDMEKQRTSDEKSVPRETTSNRQRLQLSPLEMLCKVIQEWVTENTRNFLFRSSEELFEKDQDFEYKYAVLCKNLERREREQERMEEELESQITKADNPGKKSTKPLPDYKLLAKESKKFEIKLREFYGGNFYSEKDLQVAEEMDEDDDKEEKVPIVMPTVDSHDQMLIRRRIILERLTNVLPDLLSPLSLTLLDITSDLRQLVQTFSFTNTNIIFKPAQWILVCLILIKMLSLRLLKVKNAFNQPSSSKYFTIILNGLGHQLSDLDTLVGNIITLT